MDVGESLVGAYLRQIKECHTIAFNQFLPGKQGGGWFITLLLGVVGAMLGGWLGGLLFNADLQSFFSLTTWLLAIGGSLIVLLIYGAVMNRRGAKN